MDIDFHSDEALYLQIADYFRRQVARGKLNSGDRLPAIRELAKKLGLDPGTVARAYRDLEKQGIISGRRGGGSIVSSSIDKTMLKSEQQKRLATLLEKTILEAMGMGFSPEEIETTFTTSLAQWRERRQQSKPKVKTASQERVNEIHFFGSHDIVIELLTSHVSTVYPDVRLVTSFVGSLSGLIALECGEADIAGAHLLDNETGEYNIPFIKRLMPNETVVIMNLMQRIQGLMLAPGNPKHIINLNDLKRHDVTFINRQKGSGTRILLDSQLLNLGIKPDEIKGYNQEETTHIAVANLIAEGMADVGLGAQSAATIAGLDFIPVIKERYDLVILQDNYENSKIQKIKKVVNSQTFKKMVGAMPGYDISLTGNINTVKPK